MWMDITQIERYDCASSIHRAWAIYRNTLNFIHSIQSIFSNLLLMFLNILKSNIIQIIYRCPKAYNVSNVGSPCFEFVWQFIKCGSLLMDFLNHITASNE